MSMDHTRPAPCVPLTAKDSVKRLRSFVQQTFIESLPRAKHDLDPVCKELTL